MNAVNAHNASSNSGLNSKIKRHALIAYALMIIGLFTAIPIVIGAIWAMVKRSNAAGTLHYSHYSNAIRVFWWSVFWTIIGAIFSFVLIGYLIFAILWVWALYRLVNGLAKIVDDEPYPL